MFQQDDISRPTARKEIPCSWGSICLQRAWWDTPPREELQEARMHVFRRRMCCSQDDEGLFV